MQNLPNGIRAQTTNKSSSKISSGKEIWKQEEPVRNEKCMN